jgi:hypothetical protein
MPAPLRLFALFAFAAFPAGAQQVPGRDLLAFPLGSLADAPALTGEGFALWNPALAEVRKGSRARGIVGAVDTPEDIGASVVGGMIAARLPRGITGAVSAVRGQVAGITRTADSPAALGGDLPYTSALYSIAASRRQQHVAIGVAVRYRSGTMDAQRGRGLRADAGVHADSVLGLPIRAAATTFLWQPANASDEQSVFAGAVDGDIFALGTTTARIGYAITLLPQRSNEHYGFAALNVGVWDGATGLVRGERAGEVEWSMRLGIAVRHSRYRVGLAREGMRDGIGAIYQFTLSAEMP